MNSINYDDFNNICRICLLLCDHKFSQDIVMSEMYYMIMGIRFETNDQLPQQMCPKCFEKIHEINSFVLQCKQSHSILMKFLENYKNKSLNTNTQVKNEFSTLDEITIEEHKIEFVDTGLQIKSEYIEETCAEINDLNVNSVQEDNNEKVEIEDNKWHNGLSDDINSDSTDSTNIKDVSTNEVSDLRPKPKRKPPVKRPVACEICNKIFMSTSKLNLHKRIHSGERPYACKICNKTFTRLDSLMDHQRIHSGERPYKCEICDKSFNQSSILNVHKRIHSDERHYSCEVCNKTFVRSNDLNRHKLVHSGERPYKCEICNNLYNRSSHLNRHIKRKHSNEHLESQSESSSGLKSRKTIHSGALPHKCDICSKSFKRLSLLNGHKKTHNENLVESDDLNN